MTSRTPLPPVGLYPRSAGRQSCRRDHRVGCRGPHRGDTAAGTVASHGDAVYRRKAVGLFLDARWGYRPAWIPGSLLVYQTISAWVGEGNRRAAGHGLWNTTSRIGWCAANAVTGLPALLVAWTGKTGSLNAAAAAGLRRHVLDTATFDADRTC